MENHLGIIIQLMRIRQISLRKLQRFTCKIILTYLTHREPFDPMGGRAMLDQKERVARIKIGEVKFDPFKFDAMNKAVDFTIWNESD